MSSKQAKQQELDIIRRFIDSKQIEDLKHDAHTFQQDHVIPTASQIKKAYAILLEFLRTTRPQRIIYGGTAVDLLMRRKDPRLAVYRDNTFPDIDFYSPEPYRDAVELCNRLRRAGLARISAREAMKDFTFKIRVEEASDELADISYVPGNVFQYLHNHCSEQYNGKDGWLKMTGLRYIHANVQTIDLLNVLITPATGWHKIGKQLERQTLVANHYLIPLQDPADKSRLDPRFTAEPPKTVTAMRNRTHQLIQKSACWLSGGSVAYRHFLRTLPDGDRRMLANLPVECYLAKPAAVSEASAIAKMLMSENRGWQCTVQAYHPIMSWLKHRYVVVASPPDSKQQYWIGIMNEYDNECIASRNIAGVPMLSFWATLRSCYINQHWCRLNNDPARALAYQYIGWQLRYTYRTWSRNRSLQQRTAADAPIKLLVPRCVPTPGMVNPRRKTMLKRVKDRMLDIPGMGRFTYRPEEKTLSSTTIKRGRKHNKPVYLVGKQWIRDFPNMTGRMMIPRK